MELIAHHIHQTIEQRIARIDVMSASVCCCRTLIVEELLLIEEEIKLCQILSIDVVFVFESLADDIRDGVYLIDTV